uniref:Uncharacterized protein n=1 Tax=Candidatus Kentrum sp. LPFa TaxID=2126335 RepID=A0A450W8I8_9GAMM|nr:MAG: hypothetical protein BECKLPF1236A_GA0070988_100864 [Candidatus Kentron sp. LPFa]VFK31274.1 MAG: hypothetical protein BECKLPF1236C_GA0070990_101334 [Candidatus Kentron sp. LPFa]
MWKKWFGIVLLVFLLLWATAGGVFADTCGQLLKKGLSGEGQWKEFHKECLNSKNNVEKHAPKLMDYFKDASGRNNGSYPSPGHVDDFLAEMNKYKLLTNTSERDLCEIVSLMRPINQKWGNKKESWGNEIGCSASSTGAAPRSERHFAVSGSSDWMIFFVFLLLSIMAYTRWLIWKLEKEVENIRGYLRARDAANGKMEPDITDERLLKIQNDIATLSASHEAMRGEIQKLQNPASNHQAVARVDKKTGWDALYGKLLAAETRQEIEKVLSDAAARYDFASNIGTVGQPSGREDLYFFNKKPTDEDNHGLYVIISPKKDLYYLIPCGIRNRVTNLWLNLLYTIDKDTIAIRQLKSPTQIKIVKAVDNLIYFSLGKTGELL